MAAGDCHWFLLNVFVPDIADCPTSRRSGRHIIPPLAWWTTERMLIDPYTDVSKIVCNSPVVKAREPTDKISCSLTPKTSNSCTSKLQKNKHLGIRVQQEVSLEVSASIVEKGTNSLVNIVLLLWVTILDVCIYVECLFICFCCIFSMLNVESDIRLCIVVQIVDFDQCFSISLLVHTFLFSLSSEWNRLCHFFPHVHYLTYHTCTRYWTITSLRTLQLSSILCLILLRTCTELAKCVLSLIRWMEQPARWRFYANLSSFNLCHCTCLITACQAPLNLQNHGAISCIYSRISRSAYKSTP